MDEAPSQSVPDELRCAGCGYALRGLDADSVCPECGRTVQSTLLACNNVPFDRALLWEVRFGIWAAAFSTAALAVWLVVITVWFRGLVLGTGVAFTIAAVRVVGLIGWFALTSESLQSGLHRRAPLIATRWLRVLEWIVLSLAVVALSIGGPDVWTSAAALGTIWLALESVAVATGEQALAPLDRSLGREQTGLRHAWRLGVCAAGVALAMLSIVYPRTLIVLAPLVFGFTWGGQLLEMAVRESRIRSHLREV